MFDVGAIYNPAAYGSIPDIPPYSTTQEQTVSGWSPQFPNYPGLAGQASALAGSQMAGQIPAQDLALMQQQAAERGVAIGDPLGPNADASYLLRYLGGVMNYQQQGIQNYLNLLSQSPRTTTQTGTRVVPNDVLRAIYAAAPDPYAAALANLAAQEYGQGMGEGAVRAPAPIVWGGGGGIPGGLTSRGTTLGTAGVPYATPGALTYPEGGGAIPGGMGGFGAALSAVPGEGGDWLDIGGGFSVNMATGEVMDMSGQSAGYYGAAGEPDLSGAPTYSFSDILGTTPDFGGGGYYEDLSGFPIEG